MKKFLVYLLVIVIVVSAGFAVFFLVRDNEVISISNASLYQDIGDTFTIDVNHKNKKSSTTINITSSDDAIVSYNKKDNQFVAKNGGVARINFRTTNAKFRNLWCDVIVGDGTAENPFYISTAEQLFAIGRGEATSVSGVFKGGEGYELYESDKYYKLVGNIDASSVNNGYWIPLANFNGRIDGNGLTISNINIDSSKSEVATDNVGFVSTLGSNGAIYNVKFENFTAKGTYDNFGVVAGINYGDIERVEVKNAIINVKTQVFGGLVAKNVTTDGYQTIVTNEDTENPITENVYVRNVARIDRCSINLVLGAEEIVNNEEIITNYTYNNNTIGGLVGENLGGTLVYSYANGHVYFAKDTSNGIYQLNYGGIVGINRVSDKLTDAQGSFTTRYQGASIKDCYSNITAHVKNNVDSYVIIAGAIAKNIDFSAVDYEHDTNTPIVHNYILGVYYNKDNLNIIEDGGVQEKNYKGIGLFTYTSATLNKTIDFEDTKQIVYGLTSEEMRVSSNFVSHTTKDIKFNEEGTSQGIFEEEVLWLFDTVWAISPDTNDGMPYLNYQLVYIPDDFSTAGIPVMENQITYTFIVDIEYAVDITSSMAGKLYISVNEEYQLRINPYNAQVTWSSSDDAIVAVDEKTGKITGKAVGSATVAATTRHGNSDSVTVIVEEVSYTISGHPNKVIVNKGQTKTISGIVVTPSITLTSKMQTTKIDDSATIASCTSPVLVGGESNRYAIYSLTVTGLEEGINRIILTAGRTVALVDVEVIDTTSTTGAELQITTSSSTISGELGKIATTGKVDVTSVKYNGNAFTKELSYTFKTSNSKVVEITKENTKTGTFEYRIKGAGNATIEVSAVCKDGDIVYSGTSNVTFKITATADSSSEFIELNYSKAYLLIGNSFTLKATTNTGNPVTFSSHNSNIAKVSSTGVVTGVSDNYNGYNTTTIIASTVNKYGVTIYAYCQVTVVKNEEITPTLTLSHTSAFISNGANSSFSVTATSNVAGIITWYSNVPENIVKYDTTAATNKSATLTIKPNSYIGQIKLTAKYKASASATETVSATCILTVNGTQEYSKYIYTYEQLNAVRFNLDREFYLAADIDMTDKPWTPIGTPSKPFTGTFKAMAKNNSKYFSISNMIASDNYAGVFGYIKNANIQNLTVSYSTVAGVYAGAIAGYAEASNIKNCHSENNTIAATFAAGGIVGANRKGSVIKTATVSYADITAKASSEITEAKYVGGIAGKSDEGSINNATVSKSKMQFTNNVYGYIGGIAGYSSYILKSLTVENCTITANTANDTNLAGGIVGYSIGPVENALIQTTTITGYYAGGISGALNHVSKVTIEFNECQEGYQKQDLKPSTSYKNIFYKIAVTNTVKVKGEVVGGFVAQLINGCISNSYTQAKLEGLSKNSMKAGFAVYIFASSLHCEGGTGEVGIVDTCYSACTFSGSGKNYSITSSLVHNYPADHTTRSYGFVFNYVFDDDVDGNATYKHGSGPKDYVKAKKSTSEMHNQTTYTNKGFSTAHWNFGSGYPTLKF